MLLATSRHVQAPPPCRGEGSITGESIRAPVIIVAGDEYDVIMMMLSGGGEGGR